uniref:Uncharacterized protein n=1 Tax=Haptolina brevifila TaxID=156173 RepID=A0A7S2FMJ4_9EUKA|mmetsp:Transcript_15733/g.31649  ORF Transcript_15733/g.31649 Transcript_15733/m.31649 type:complete len:334 (+) Transcript_15733:1282-2283(+)
MLLTPVLNPPAIAPGWRRLPRSCTRGSVVDVTFATRGSIDSQSPDLYASGSLPRGPCIFYATAHGSRLDAVLREKLHGMRPPESLEMITATRGGRVASGVAGGSELAVEDEGGAESREGKSTMACTCGKAPPLSMNGEVKLCASHYAGPSLTERSDRAPSDREGPGRLSCRSPGGTPTITPPAVSPAEVTPSSTERTAHAADTRQHTDDMDLGSGIGNWLTALWPANGAAGGRGGVDGSAEGRLAAEVPYQHPATASSIASTHTAAGGAGLSAACSADNMPPDDSINQSPLPSDRSLGSGIGGLWSPAGGGTPVVRSPLASARAGAPQEAVFV